VARDFAGTRRRDGGGEQKSAAVAAVSDALRDAGQAGNQRSLERVGEQDGGVEAALAQSAGQTQPGGEGARRGDVLVAERLPSIKAGDPGTRQNGQVRLRVRSLMARSAGRDRTASPTQLAARTRMLDQPPH